MPRIKFLACLLLVVVVLGAHFAHGKSRSGADSLPVGTVLERDIGYGPDPAQRLDVYRTSAQGAVLRPVILMVHGGAWQFGDKGSRGVAGNKVSHWLPRGYVFVSINYRMLAVLDGIDQADDVARALAFVQTHARGWGGDPDKVVLMGHSAGAHLVALLSASPSRAEALGAKPWLGAVALDSGALDIPALMQRRHLPLYDRAFGKDPARWRLGSPIHVLRPGARPMLFVCSAVRRDRPCDQARKLADSAEALAVRVELLPQDLDHADINHELGLAGPYTEAVDRFLQSLGAAGAGVPR